MRALLLLALAVPAAPALALDCGDAIDRDVVLTADLNCASDALRVVRSGVRIDLGGHTIRTVPGATAVVLDDVHGVIVHGPGRIEGAMTGIEATRARGLSVQGVHFTDLGEGVRLTNADHADIRGNRFDGLAGHAVVALTLPGALTRGGGHRIVDNTVRNAEYGVLVDAAYGRDSRVDGNTFDGIGTFGVIAHAPVAVHDNHFGAIGVAAVVD